MMRQAGRYLPEYQETRKRAGSFWTMCMTPELATEVTLQPITRYDFDAAIIFSDILVIPHALGQSVRFEDGIGPVLEPLTSVEDLEGDKSVWEERLRPVYEALEKTRSELKKEKALIGFAGAPWTLAAYMLEGRGSKEQVDARLWAYRNPAQFDLLLGVLAKAVAVHLVNQLKAGADVVQIFDSWAGGLPWSAFKNWVVDPTKAIVREVREKVPGARIIGFPRQGTQSGLEAYAAETGVDGISIDTATPIDWAADNLGSKVIVQGNLDPMALIAGGRTLDGAIDEILNATVDIRAIFNLGHGVLPSTPVENVQHLVDRVRG
jgi:uroporphyrinogen decarboxylase